MKVLIINGFDFAVTHFENNHKGVKVISIINDLESFKPDGSDEYEEWDLSVVEIKGGC